MEEWGELWGALDELRAGARCAKPDDGPPESAGQAAAQRLRSMLPQTPQVQQARGTCDFCGAAAIQLVAGNYECGACGTVLERFIDHGAEWRTFGGDDDGRWGVDPTRCGPPVSHLLPTLGCVIAGNGCGSRAMRIVQKYQAWGALTYRERTLCGVFDLMSVNAATFGIAQCILEEAKAMYKRLTHNRVVRGELRGALVAACLYVACKTNGVPRSVKEVAAMFGLRQCAMTRGCRMCEQLLRIDVGTSEAADFVGRFCSRLALEPGPTEVCRHVVARADELAVAPDCMPPTLVAGAILLVDGALGLGLDRAAVAGACMISAATAVKCLRRLQAHAGELLPEGGADAYATRWARPRATHAQDAEVAAREAGPALGTGRAATKDRHASGGRRVREKAGRQGQGGGGAPPTVWWAESQWAKEASS